MLTTPSYISLFNYHNCLYFFVEKSSMSLSLSARFNFTILFIAFFHSEFAKERERAENRRAFFKFRSREKLERQFTAYSDWIGRAGKKNVTSTSAHVNKQTINCIRFTIQFSRFERALFSASLSW